MSHLQKQKKSHRIDQRFEANLNIFGNEQAIFSLRALRTRCAFDISSQIYTEMIDMNKIEMCLFLTVLHNV